MRLYIIRHGDPDYANNTITPQGHLEAQALAKRLAKEGIDRIYSSPMGRAKDTMRYTADLLGIEPNIEYWTEELHCMIDLPPWGRTCLFNTPGEMIRCAEPQHTNETWYEAEPFKSFGFRQKYEELRSSSDEFLARHGYVRQGGLYRIVRPNREKIAVFCHAGFGMTWLSILLELPLTLVWSGFWLPTTSVTTILFDERSEQWAVPRCLGQGDGFPSLCGRAAGAAQRNRDKLRLTLPNGS